jgi:hypothetical protein
MAETIRRSQQPVEAFRRLGFFVVAPIEGERGRIDSNLERCMTAESIRKAVRDRIVMYERMPRPEAEQLCNWEQSFVLPLVERMEKAKTLRVLSWEECIDAIGRCNRQVGAQLLEFYQRCLSYRLRGSQVIAAPPPTSISGNASCGEPRPL